MIKEFFFLWGFLVFFLLFFFLVRCSGFLVDYLRGVWVLEKVYNYKMVDEESLFSF